MFPHSITQNNAYDHEIIPLFFFTFVIALFFSSFLQLILFQHGDIEINPGPQKTGLNSFLYSHWNVSSFISHKMAKPSQIEAYNNFWDILIHSLIHTI